MKISLLMCKKVYERAKKEFPKLIDDNTPFSISYDLGLGDVLVYRLNGAKLLFPVVKKKK